MHEVFEDPDMHQVFEWLDKFMRNPYTEDDQLVPAGQLLDPEANDVGASQLSLQGTCTHAQPGRGSHGARATIESNSCNSLPSACVCQLQVQGWHMHTRAYAVVI